MSTNRVTQTAFKPYNQVMSSMTTDYPFYERGAIAVQNRKDVSRNIYGVPTALAQNLHAPQYNQPMDIVAQYRNRALPIPTDLITAAMINGQASFLTYASPIFLTSEKNFTSKHREINQVGFSRIPQAGIPHEQTSNEITWNTTVEKFSFSFPMLLDFALDDNYGAEEWAFQLGGMASNAMYTVYQQIAFGFVQIGYENIVSNHMKNTPFDHSKLLLKESESFCIAATDPDRLLRMIRDFENTIPGVNMVIIPQGTAVYIEKIKGESTIMPIQRIATDEKTNRVIIELDELNGPRTVKTVYFGDRYYQFVEMPNFRVNSQDDRFMQPLQTAATVCQMYQCDPDLTANTESARSDDINDPYLYFQTKTTGDHVRVSYIEALRSAFYWDDKGKVSKIAKGFLKAQNTKGTKPSFEDGNYLDVEDSDNNTPHRTKDIMDKTDLRAMKKFREEFVGLTFDADSGAYRIPKNLGSFHLRHLPNVWVEKSAKAIHKEINSVACINSDSMMRETIDLLNDIANTVPTQEYLMALREANAQFNFSMNGDLVGSQTPEREAYPNAAQLTEWKGNEFGALRLPKKRGGITATYPWGFDSGPGLLTLAKEADSETSDWSEAGQRAKKVVRYLEILEQAIDAYIGNSDVINPAHTLPWFHVGHSIATIVDHLRHYKAPVFLSLPNVEPGSTNTEFSGNYGKYVAVPKSSKFESCLPSKYSGEITSNLKKVDASDITGQIIIDNLHNFVISTCGWDSTKNDPKTVAFITVIALWVSRLIVSSSSNNRQEILDTLEVLRLGKKPGTDKYKKILTDDPSLNAIAKENLSNDKDTAFTLEFDKLDNSGAPYSVHRDNIDKLEQARGRALIANDANALAKANKDLEDYRKDLYGEQHSNRSTIEGKSKAGPNVRYLRAPLMASEKIIDYLKTLTDGLAPLILMADPGTLYETTIDVYESDTYINHATFKSQAFNSPVNFTINALPLSFGFQERQESGSEFKSSSSTSTRRDNEDNIFSSLKSNKQSDIMSDILSGTNAFGRAYDMDDNRSDILSNRFTNRNAMSNIAFGIPIPSNTSYLNPWNARMTYMKDRIKSPTTKFLFKATISAPNERRSFEAPAGLGQKLINVVLIRPFIEQRVSSILVLEAGANTSLTPIGGFSLTVSKEERGISHTKMDFNTGLIKVNPNNIGMIYGCIPDSHIGGMKVDFLRDPQDFIKQNPYKPSIIAMLAPVSEFLYEYPIHLTGLSNYNRDDVMLAHLRKISFAQFFEHVFDPQVLNHIEGMHEERISHGHHVQVSLQAHRGPCGYRDYNESSHRIKWTNGTGPRGSLEMNSGRAYETHNGKATYYPVFNHQ